MDSEIVKLILQSGSGAVALFALWLYHHSVKELFQINSKLREDNDKLIDACLKLAGDRETLNGVLLKTLEILAAYGDTRETTKTGHD